eukprot:m.74650 g.74650  ORF g.74650 m.74650 type:complete len:69 (+) comp35902_c1_seq3:989-1195(+)
MTSRLSNLFSSSYNGFLIAKGGFLTGNRSKFIFKHMGVFPQDVFTRKWSSCWAIVWGGFLSIHLMNLR